ncbi:MAG: hypothetical protein WCY37_01200 [Candidatus Dojkabacteria bacterium]
MEKHTALKAEGLDRNEALRNSGKRIICDSLLLAAEVIEKNRNVWDLVKKGIVDDQNELVQSVGILLGMEMARKHERAKGGALPEKLQFTFGWKYQALKGEDFEDVVCEYEAIREWLKDPDSEV